MPLLCFIGNHWLINTQTCPAVIKFGCFRYLADFWSYENIVLDIKHFFVIMKSNLSRWEDRTYFSWKFVNVVYNFRMFSLLVCESPFVLFPLFHCAATSVLSDSVTLWTVACQATMSMGFSRQEYWSGLPFLPPGDLLDPGIKHMSLVSPALARGFFSTSATWEAPVHLQGLLLNCCCCC